MLETEKVKVRFSPGGASGEAPPASPSVESGGDSADKLTPEQRKTMSRRGGFFSGFRRKNVFEDKALNRTAEEEEKVLRFDHSDVMGEAKKEMEDEFAKRVFDAEETKALERKEKITQLENDLAELLRDFYSGHIAKGEISKGTETDADIRKAEQDLLSFGVVWPRINAIVYEAMKETGYLEFLEKKNIERRSLGKSVLPGKVEGTDVEAIGEILFVVEGMYEEFYKKALRRGIATGEEAGEFGEDIKELEAEALRLGATQEELDVRKQMEKNLSGYDDWVAKGKRVRSAVAAKGATAAGEGLGAIAPGEPTPAGSGAPRIRLEPVAPPLSGDAAPAEPVEPSLPVAPAAEPVPAKDPAITESWTKYDEKNLKNYAEYALREAEARKQGVKFSEEDEGNFNFYRNLVKRMGLTERPEAQPILNELDRKVLEMFKAREATPEPRPAEILPEPAPAADKEKAEAKAAKVRLASGEDLEIPKDDLPVYENWLKDLETRQELYKKSHDGRTEPHLEAELKEARKILRQARRAFAGEAATGKEAEEVELAPDEVEGMYDHGVLSEGQMEKLYGKDWAPKVITPLSAERIGELRGLVEQFKLERANVARAKKNRKSNPQAYAEALKHYQEKRASYVGDSVLRMLKERQRLLDIETGAKGGGVGRFEKIWNTIGGKNFLSESAQAKVAAQVEKWAKSLLPERAWKKMEGRLGATVAKSFNVRTMASLGLLGVGLGFGVTAGIGLAAIVLRAGIGVPGTYFGSKKGMEWVAKRYRSTTSKSEQEEIAKKIGELKNAPRSEYHIRQSDILSMMEGREVKALFSGENLEKDKDYQELKKMYLKFGREMPRDLGMTKERFDSYLRSSDLVLQEKENVFAAKVERWDKVRRGIALALAAVPGWRAGSNIFNFLNSHTPAAVIMPRTSTSPGAAAPSSAGVRAPEVAPGRVAAPTPAVTPTPGLAGEAPRVITPERPPGTPIPEPLSSPKTAEKIFSGKPEKFANVEKELTEYMRRRTPTLPEDADNFVTQVEKAVGPTAAVGKGEGLWQAAVHLVDEKEITPAEFQRAWKNTFLEVHGKRVHISEVGLVHEKDIVRFVPASGAKGPHFEIVRASKLPLGTNKDLFAVYEKAGRPAPEWLRKAVGADITIEKVARAPVSAAVETASPVSAAGKAVTVEQETTSSIGPIAGPEAARTVDHFRNLGPVDQEGMIESLRRDPANNEVVGLLLRETNFQEALRRFETMRESLIPANEYAKIKDMPVQKFLASIAEAKNATEEADRIAVVGRGKWKIAKAVRALAPDTVTQRLGLDKFLKITFWEFPEYLQD